MNGSMHTVYLRAQGTTIPAYFKQGGLRLMYYKDTLAIEGDKISEAQIDKLCDVIREFQVYVVVICLKGKAKTLEQWNRVKQYQFLHLIKGVLK